MPFQQAVFPLLILSFVMIAGWSWPKVIAERYVEIQDSPAYSVWSSGPYSNCIQMGPHGRRPFGSSLTILVAVSRFSSQNGPPGGSFSLWFCSISSTGSSSWYWTWEMIKSPRFQWDIECWMVSFKYSTAWWNLTVGCVNKNYWILIDKFKDSAPSSTRQLSRHDVHLSFSLGFEYSTNERVREEKFRHLRYGRWREQVLIRWAISLLESHE